MTNYTPNKKIEKPVYNEYATNPTGWSGPINTDWDIIDSALGGVLPLSAVGAVGTVNLSITQTQSLIINITGAMTGNAIYTLPLNAASTGIVGGNWIVYNNTSGAFTVTFTPVAGGGTSVAIAQGTRSLIYSDGTNIAAVTSAAGTSGQVIYNSANILTGSSNLVFNGTTLTAAGLASSGSITAGTTIAATTAITAGTTITATGNITAFSDRSLKRDIQTIEHALDLVGKMRGVTFEMINTGQQGIGVVAQEVQEVIPQVVQDNNGILSVAYGNLVGVLIEAVKELKARIEALESK
jgi:hypothetical protein